MDNPVRFVVREEIDEIWEWAYPFFQKRHPRATLEAMRPLFEAAVENKSSYHLVRTDNTCGFFAIERTPWEPLPVVCDVLVAKRYGLDSPFEVCRTYNEGLEWARGMKAVEYRYGTDGLSNLNGIAQRIGYDIMATNYVKKL